MDNAEKKEIKEMILARAEEQGDCLAWGSISSGENPAPIPLRHGTYGWIHPRNFLYEYEFGKVPGEITMSCGNHKCINVKHMVVKGFNVEAGESRFMPVNVITQNIDTQPRAVIFNDVVEEYADEMLNNIVFPPVDVFFDGSLYWLADGYHRVRAAELASRDKINVVVHDGTKRDAILFSFGANSKHGLRRTNEDKRRAVSRLLSDKEWSKWSNRRLAEIAGVDEKTIRNWREQLDVNTDQREYIDQAGNINTWDIDTTLKNAADEIAKSLDVTITEDDNIVGVKSMHAERIQQLVDYFGESAKIIVYLAVYRLSRSVFEHGEIIDAAELEEVR